MSKVKRFSLEERYGYQNRKVIYDKKSDNDIELNNIYPIIGLFNQFDEQISDLQHRLEVAENALNEMANDWCLMDNPNKPSDVVKKYKEEAEKEVKGEKDE